jgi:hypothetical protein
MTNFFESVKKNLKSFELCNPSLFVPLEATYNVHKFNTNYIFKAKSNSVLTYLFCRVSKRDRITLNSICKEIGGTLEDIEYLDVENSKNKILDFVVYGLLLLINLDLILSLLFYIANFRVFQRAQRIYELNIFSIIGACIGLLNFTILGFKIPFIELSPIIPITPNIGFFNSTLNVMLSLLFVVFIVSTTVVRFYFNTNSREQSADFKSLLELKI